MMAIIGDVSDSSSLGSSHTSPGAFVVGDVGSPSLVSLGGAGYVPPPAPQQQQQYLPPQHHQSPQSQSQSQFPSSLSTPTTTMDQQRMHPMHLSNQPSYSSSMYGSFSGGGGEVPVISLDITIFQQNKTEGLGFQPLRFSLSELHSKLADRRRFSDGAEWIRRFWFAGTGGLPILRVDAGGPADVAGLMMCDVIVSINGKDVREVSQSRCAKMVKEQLVKSDSITLAVIRCTQLPYDPAACAVFADQARTTKAQNFSIVVRIPILAENTAFGFTPLKYSFCDTDLPRSERCMVQEIRRKLPFAVGGLPVQSVDPDGPAAQAGLQAWDVIAEVNGVDVQTKTASQITSLIRTALVPLNLARKSDEVLELRVVRSATPIASTTPKSSAVHRAISGLHWLSSPGKNKNANNCAAFGTRASEVDTGDIVVAEVDTYSY